MTYSLSCGPRTMTAVTPTSGEDLIRVEGSARLVGEMPVGGAKNSALKLMAAALLATGKTVLRNVPRITDIAHHGRGAAAAGLRRADRGSRTAISSSTRRPSRARIPTMTWSAGCAPRSASWDRCWPGAAGSGWPIPAATRSAPAAWTCTWPAWPGWGPRSAASTASSGRRAGRAARRPDLARLPERRRDREPAHGRCPGQGRHGDRQRGSGAGDRRHLRDADRDGRADHRRRHFEDRDRGRAELRPCSTAPSATGSSRARGPSRPP